MNKKILFLTALFFGISRIYSQTVDASPETQTICGGATATLSAVVTPGAGTPPTNSYTISSIAYAPDAYGAGTVVGGMGDDTQSGILPIGFNFCFFGTTYSNFYVGSNGWVAFSPQPTTFTSAPIPSVAAGIPKNCIMGPWQDWYPGLAPNCVRYQLLGIAPFRRLVVSWDNCPMFSCTTTFGTFQITIYETTNVIENHIQLKPACLAWAGGTAVQGLHNAAGTIAFAVAGRNSTAWVAANESWRYTPNGTSLYQVNWYILPANTLIGTGSPITVTPPASPQYYYAEVIDLNSCTAAGSGNTDTVVVLTNVVAVDAGAYTPICAGSSANLNATSAAAISYTWSPAGSLSNPNIANPIATPGATTTYTVSVLDGMGCTGTDTVTIAIANPIVTTSATPAVICNGTSSALNASGGASYAWLPAGSLSNPAISNPVASPTATTTYTVTVTGAGIGCTTTALVTVTVNPLPVVDAGTPVAICTGTTTTLNATGATGYVWSPAGSLSSSTISNPISSATTTTSYTVVGTDGNGCTSSDNVTITVNPLPVVDAGPNTTICPSASTTLNGSGATTYSWTPAGSLSNPAIANPVASPTSATTYTVVGTDGNGCSSSDVVTISINPINVFTTGTATICSGASTGISAFGAANYLWSPAGSLSNATVSSPTANPTSTTTYTVVGTNAAGCNDTAFVTITVNPLPIVDAGISTAMCSGATTTLNATGATGYAWSPAGSLSSATVSNPTSSATTTTTYTVVGTDGNGCTASDNVTITVNPLPVVDAGPDQNICAGINATLNGSGAVNYSWSPAGSLSNPGISNPVASPSSATTYTLVGTDLNGCSATDTVMVSVNGIIVTASSASSAICMGSTTTLSAAGGATYLWSPAAALSNDTITNPVASPATTTTYTLIGTAASGCADTAFVTITVTPLPLVNAGSAVSICNGTTTTLGATGATNYVWSPAGSLSSATIANPVSSATATTTYTVVGTDGSGCSASDTVSVTVLSLPAASAGTATAICNGTSTTLSASGGATYSWSPAGSLSSPTIANPVATPAATTTYTVTATGTNGCTASASVTITVNPVPTATASADIVICSGGSTTITASGGGTYLWSPGTGLSSTTSASPTANPATTTFYTVTVSNGMCTDTAGILVTVNSVMSMATPTSTDATCGNTNGSVTAGVITGGAAPYSYTLNGGPSQASATFTGLSSGSYTITATDAAGCTASQTVIVGSTLGVNAAFSASPTSGSSPLTVNLTNGSSGASDYIWDFGDGTSSILTNPSVVYGVNGSYTIMLVAYNGSFACADTTTILINVFDAAMMIVPNVFTPNGDGVNDVFVVQSTGIKSIEGVLFNRWGRKIGEWSGSAATGWDGKINGNSAEDGTYYYIIKAIGMDNKEYERTGFVQLLAN